MPIRIQAFSTLKFGEYWDSRIEDLAHQLIAKLLQASVLDWSAIDAVLVANCFAEPALGLSSLHLHLRDRLGVNKPFYLISGSDACGAQAIQQAANLLKAGQAKRVLVLGVEKMSDLLGSQTQSLLSSLLDQDEAFYGQTLSGAWALLTQAYLNKYQLQEADLAQVSAWAHERGSLNPTAQFCSAIPAEAILNSPFTSSPLRMLMGASFPDGASALVLEATDDKQGIFLTASASAHAKLPLAHREDLTFLTSTQSAAQLAYQQAGIKPDQIDLAEVHDVFATSELMSLEALGFCQPGEAFSLTKSIAIECHSRENGNPASNSTLSRTATLTINPSGGYKACGHAPGASGIRQAVEICQHLSGQAGDRQVQKAKIGLTQTMSGAGTESIINVFQALS